MSNNPVGVKESTQIAIKKGYKPSELEPLVSVVVPGDKTKLKHLREYLTKSKHMVASDVFLTPELFPVHKEDEATHDWKSVYAIKKPVTAPSVEKPKRKEGDQADKHSEEDDSSQHQGAYIAILSSPTSKRPVITPPELPSQRQHTNLEDPKAIPMPDQEEIIAVATDNAATSVVNIRMLSEEQIQDIFHINGILCGSSLATHPTARLCAEVFSPPESIHDTIRVSDPSSIETHTTFSATQAAFAQHGFQEASVQAGTPWVAASISASRSTAASQNQQSDTQYTTAIYRFSRAVVQLPLSSMKPSANFASDLNNALSRSTNDEKRLALLDFFSKYGHAIASEIHLGGHLHTTKITKSTQNANQAETEMEVRASVSSVIHLGGSGGAGSKDKGQKKDAQQSASTTIEAVGGNTLLVSNPAIWPLSLMPYTNWRVTKLSNVKLLTDIPSLFTPEQRNIVRLILGSKEVPFDP